MFARDEEPRASTPRRPRSPPNSESTLPPSVMTMADFDPNAARAQRTEKPVADIYLTFTWYANYWEQIFDRQIRLIQRDVQRARDKDRIVVYLSCPISSRGGSFHGTNVDIARNTERRLLSRWGERFWILNPAQYQL